MVIPDRLLTLPNGHSALAVREAALLGSSVDTAFDSRSYSSGESDTAEARNRHLPRTGIDSRGVSPPSPPFGCGKRLKKFRTASDAPQASQLPTYWKAINHTRKLSSDGLHYVVNTLKRARFRQPQVEHQPQKSILLIFKEALGRFNSTRQASPIDITEVCNLNNAKSGRGPMGTQETAALDLLRLAVFSKAFPLDAWNLLWNLPRAPLAKVLDPDFLLLDPHDFNVFVPLVRHRRRGDDVILRISDESGRCAPYLYLHLSYHRSDAESERYNYRSSPPLPSTGSTVLFSADDVFDAAEVGKKYKSLHGKSAGRGRRALGRRS